MQVSGLYLRSSPHPTIGAFARACSEPTPRLTLLLSYSLPLVSLSYCLPMPRSQDGCEGNWGKDGSNRLYGPSSGQIDSNQPFHILATFPSTSGGAGAAFNVRLAQGASMDELLQAAGGAGRGGLLLDPAGSNNLPASRGAVPVSEHDQMLTRTALQRGLVLVASLYVLRPQHPHRPHPAQAHPLRPDTFARARSSLGKRSGKRSRPPPTPSLALIAGGRRKTLPGWMVGARVSGHAAISTQPTCASPTFASLRSAPGRRRRRRCLRPHRRHRLHRRHLHRRHHRSKVRQTQTPDGQAAPLLTVAQLHAAAPTSWHPPCWSSQIRAALISGRTRAPPLLRGRGTIPRRPTRGWWSPWRSRWAPS
jgi:hypothetical protein